MLNHIIAAGGPLNTPTRTYIRRLTRAAEIYQAELAIAKKQYDELHTVVMTRNERKPLGKQKSIDGHTVVSLQEIHDEFQKLEQAIRERRKPKNRSYTTSNEEP